MDHHTISSEHYVSDYIRRALASDSLEPPNKAQSNGQYDALESLYDAHQLGGVSAAQGAWEAIKRMRPAWAEFDPNCIPKLIHADHLKDLSAPMYLLTYYPIYKGGFNVLIGPSSAGKSFVALDIAGRVALEQPAIYVAGEGIHGYAARWEAWKSFHKYTTAELYFFTEALQVMDEAQLSSFINLIASLNPAMVIIDTLARSAVGMEENSAKEMGQFVSACDALRVRANVTLLVVHHTGKSGEIRGSTALYGAADCVLALKNNDGQIDLSNSQDAGGKNKHAPEAPTKHFRIVPHSAPPFEGAVLVEAQQVISSSEDRLTGSQETILDCIADYGDGVDAQTIVKTTNIKQSTVYYSLKKLVKQQYLDYDKSLYSLHRDRKF